MSTMTEQITFAAEYVRRDVQRGPGEERDWEHNLWRVTITLDGRSFSTDYRMGIGLEDLKPVRHFASRQKAIAEGTIRYNGIRPGVDAVATPRTPTMLEVLYSLQSDCRAGDELFEDFADDYGYDRDSRKAYAIWEACRTMHLELRKFFGNYARFQEFMETDWEEQECSSS